MTTFPEGFLWGAATAAHQIEGNNTNTDCWVLEYTPGTIFREPSGEACDSYHRWQEDISLLREVGLNAYRFSIEWARVEPADGHFSQANLQHYANVLRCCLDSGLTPVVTLHHFTSPRWLMRQGGWGGAETPARFAHYASEVMSALGDQIPYICTINEANINTILAQLGVGFRPAEQPKVQTAAPIGIGEGLAEARAGVSGWWAACAQELGTTPDRLKPANFSAPEDVEPTLMAAHVAAREAIKAVRPEIQVGITLALHDWQAQPGGEEQAERLKHEAFGKWLPTLEGDDFLGVQNYSRQRIGPEGVLPNEEGVETTQMGYEFYPEALEGMIRQVAVAGLPMIVTENGVSTEDDTRRVEFIDRAIAGVERCLADGLDIQGYLYWSALDNFEWALGYGPKFGIIAVDRATQQRTPKPSAHRLGQMAIRNGPLR
ncbi:MAG: family 1 glycosylhydrolase [Chloroflexota bacterium]|nr:family 1 glycosylhydrolase [Chloroflexota bacterium]